MTRAMSFMLLIDFEEANLNEDRDRLTLSISPIWIIPQAKERYSKLFIFSFPFFSFQFFFPISYKFAIFCHYTCPLAVLEPIM